MRGVDLRPEGLVREFAPEDHGRAGREDGETAHALRGGVVEGEAGVHLVGGEEADFVAGGAQEHCARAAYYCAFRLACCAGGVD